jgi:PAS domain-containing protein
MEEKNSTSPLEELVKLAMDYLEEAVTVFDPQGTLLYYNRRAAEILDRKPEYLGTDIHLLHKKAITNQKWAGCVHAVRLKEEIAVAK